VMVAGESDSKWLELSGDENNPTPVVAGMKYWFAVWVYEAGSGISDGVSLQILSQDVVVAETVLPLAQQTDQTGNYYTFYSESFTWTPGIGVYTIKVSVKDNVGHEATTTRYAEAAPVTVEGYFTVNGEMVDETSSLLLDTRTVTFTYVAASGASAIESVQVSINGEGVSEVIACQKSDSTWTASYTFPRDGVYEVKGEVRTVTGDVLVPLSLVVNVGWSGGLPLSFNQLLGILLIALGLIVYWRG